jgi:hypothetical protein
MDHRLHICAAPACLLVLSIVLTPSISRAQSAPISPIKCHTQLADLDKQKNHETYFGAMTPDELETLLGRVSDCVSGFYLQLSREDLRTAAFVLRFAQYVSDNQNLEKLQSATASLQKKYNDLLAASSSKTIPTPETHASQHTLKVTISPLPSGFNRVLTIGGTEYVCHSIESMEMNCALPNAGRSSYSLYDLVAMYAKSSVLTYLIGCNPVLSGNCFTMVPGDYEAELVGADGLMISDVVTEGKPDEPPKHAIFVIYDRR